MLFSSLVNRRGCGGFALTINNLSSSRLVMKSNVLVLRNWCLSEDGTCATEQHTKEDIWEAIEKRMKENKVLVFSKSFCPYCAKVKNLFQLHGIDYALVELDQNSEGEEIQKVLIEKTGQRTVPEVFVMSKKIGGSSETIEAWENGTIKKLLENST